MVVGSNPVGRTIKTHAKGAYKTPSRVSFSMQNRGKLPFLWQFTLFVVSSRIAVGICSILALGNRNSLTIAQKGFLHDKERMISYELKKEKVFVFDSPWEGNHCVYQVIMKDDDKYRAKILFVQSLKACDFSKRVKNKSLRRYSKKQQKG